MFANYSAQPFVFPGLYNTCNSLLIFWTSSGCDISFPVMPKVLLPFHQLSTSTNLMLSHYGIKITHILLKYCWYWRPLLNRWAKHKTNLGSKPGGLIQFDGESDPTSININTHIMWLCLSMLCYKILLLLACLLLCNREQYLHDKSDVTYPFDNSNPMQIAPSSSLTPSYWQLVWSTIVGWKVVDKKNGGAAPYRVAVVGSKGGGGSWVGAHHFHSFWLCPTLFLMAAGSLVQQSSVVWPRVW